MLQGNSGYTLTNVSLIIANNQHTKVNREYIDIWGLYQIPLLFI